MSQNLQIPEWINELRDEEDGVMISDSAYKAIVDCWGQWTGWRHMYFRGTTLAIALHTAVMAKREAAARS